MGPLLDVMQLTEGVLRAAAALTNNMTARSADAADIRLTASALDLPRENSFHRAPFPATCTVVWLLGQKTEGFECCPVRAPELHFDTKRLSQTFRAGTVNTHENSLLWQDF